MSGADYRQAQEQQEHEMWLESEVCVYCHHLRGDKIVCCGENHFELGEYLENDKHS